MRYRYFSSMYPWCKSRLAPFRKRYVAEGKRTAEKVGKAADIECIECCNKRVAFFFGPKAAAACIRWHQQSPWLPHEWRKVRHKRKVSGNVEHVRTGNILMLSRKQAISGSGWRYDRLKFSISFTAKTKNSLSRLKICFIWPLSRNLTGFCFCFWFGAHHANWIAYGHSARGGTFPLLLWWMFPAKSPR